MNSVNRSAAAGLNLKGGVCFLFLTWEGCDKVNHVFCPSV